MPAGRTPKPDGKAVTRHKPSIESVELGSAPVGGSGKQKISEPPEAPAPGAVFSRAEWRKLHRFTRRWWVTWLDAEQASQFIATDWTRLFMVGVPLAEAFNRARDEGDVDRMDKLAGRLIQLEREFGATPDGRLRMRWKVRPAGAAPAGSSDGDESGKARAPRSVKPDPRLSLVEGGRASG